MDRPVESQGWQRSATWSQPSPATEPGLPGTPPTPTPLPVREVVVAPRKAPRPTRFAVAFFLASLVAVGGVSFAIGRMTAPASSAGGVARLPDGFPAGFPGLGGVQATDTGQDANASDASAAPEASPSAPDGGQGQGGLGGGFPAGGPGRGFLGGGVGIEGTVTAISDTAITLQLTDGRTQEISLSADTAWSRQAEAAPADITVGSSVRVQIDPSGLFGAPGASPAPGAGAATEVVLLTAP